MTARKPPGEYDKCLGKLHGRDGLCTRPAGWGTDHAGIGRCKLHGGCNPIKHGRYSKYAREKLAEKLAEQEADPDPLDLTPDLALMRAHTAFFLDKHGPSPMVADFTDRATKIVDMIQRHKKEGAITLQTLQRVVEQLGIAVAKHVKDPDILAAIERDWGTISIGP